MSSSYPPETSGLGAPVFMRLTGKQVTNANPQTIPGTLVGGNNTYKVSLSVSNSNSATGLYGNVVITATLYDLAANAVAIVGSATAISYNSDPTTRAAGTNESYIGAFFYNNISGLLPNNNVDANGFYQGGLGEVATVSAVTILASAAKATITPLNLGQAVVEFAYPFAGNSEGLIGGALGGQQNDAVFSQVLVTVVP